MTILRSAVAWLFLLSITLLPIADIAHAGIEAPTRVVFDGTSQDMTLTLRNPGNKPSLIQVWLDSGDPDATPETIQVPFLLTPALVRIEPESSHRLRIVALADAAQLPQDRETRYFLNLLDVPSKPVMREEEGGAMLNLAVHYRMPLLYRPAPLKPDHDVDGSLLPKAATKVRWTLSQRDGEWRLDAENPTPYSLSLRQISIGPTGTQIGVATGELLPLSKASFALNSVPESPPGEAPWLVFYMVADDSGKSVPGLTPLG